MQITQHIGWLMEYFFLIQFIMLKIYIVYLSHLLSIEFLKSHQLQNTNYKLYHFTSLNFFQKIKKGRRIEK